LLERLRHCPSIPKLGRKEERIYSRTSGSPDALLRDLTRLAFQRLLLGPELKQLIASLARSFVLFNAEGASQKTVDSVISED
jgi:hypothetical protein